MSIFLRSISLGGKAYERLLQKDTSLDLRSKYTVKAGDDICKFLYESAFHRYCTYEELRQQHSNLDLFYLEPELFYSNVRYREPVYRFIFYCPKCFDMQLKKYGCRYLKRSWFLPLNMRCTMHDCKMIRIPLFPKLLTAYQLLLTGSYHPFVAYPYNAEEMLLKPEVERDIARLYEELREIVKTDPPTKYWRQRATYIMEELKKNFSSNSSFDAINLISLCQTLIKKLGTVTFHKSVILTLGDIWRLNFLGACFELDSLSNVRWATNWFLILWCILLGRQDDFRGMIREMNNTPFILNKDTNK